MVAFIKRKRHHIVNYTIMALCGVLSLYVFASSFETVFNKDLPLVESVDTVSLDPVARYLSDIRSVDQGQVGNYGFPQYLKLPSQDAKMALVPGIEDNSQFLVRASAAHYFLQGVSENGNLGDILVYFEKSWRTSSNPENIKPGDNIFIDTDRDWRYFYRIDEVKTVQYGQQPYVGREVPATKLLLVSVNKGQSSLIVAQASLVNVQNVRL